MAKSESVVDPAARDKYLLEVTTGPSYDPSQHRQVSVNGPNPTHVESDIVTAWIKVRIKYYHGLPHGSPSSSKYFDHKLHTTDRYSIAFSFVPKKDVSGSDLVMGFDYDHSIKHQLPPGFRYAMRIATSLLDPGLYSDAYSDEPYLYGPALSSFFAFRIGERTDDISADEQLASLEREADGVVEEGAEGSGKAVRKDAGLPAKWKRRRKHFLDAKALSSFTFEKGRMYHADFFNPHLDFANFSLRLPGFSISVAKYIDEKTHHLRFVLKNRKTEEVLFVVFFKLLFGKELEEKLDEGKTIERSQNAPATGTGSATGTKEEDSLKNTRPVEKEAPSLQPDSPKKEPEKENGEENGGITSTATTAASNLANSIYAVYAAMGFGRPSSSESDTSSRSSSRQPSSRSVEAQIDDMDDATIAQYLQSHNGSTK
ncbi:Nn.00g085310.m01.CDS01 [Neocucurbitaria sp. VM-36]